MATGKRLWSFLAVALVLVACNKQEQQEKGQQQQKEQEQEKPKDAVLTPSDVPNYEKIYMCSEFYKNARGWDVTSTFYDPLLPTSFYYFGRSRQSEHLSFSGTRTLATKAPTKAPLRITWILKRSFSGARKYMTTT